MDFYKREFDEADCIQLNQDKVQWR